MPLRISDALVGEALAKLSEQSRFAYAWRPDQGHDLTPTGVDLLDEGVQQPQFAFPPHQWASGGAPVSSPRLAPGAHPHDGIALYARGRVSMPRQRPFLQGYPTAHQTSDLWSDQDFTGCGLLKEPCWQRQGFAHGFYLRLRM